MSFSPSDLILRCLAEQDGDSWFVICLDLNLYVRADSFEQGRARLNDLIKEYLNEAFAEDKDYLRDLFPRPAPIHFWLKYWIALFRIRCHLAISSLNKHLFTEYLPLKPVT